MIDSKIMLIILDFVVNILYNKKIKALTSPRYNKIVVTENIFLTLSRT